MSSLRRIMTGVEGRGDGLSMLGKTSFRDSLSFPHRYDIHENSQINSRLGRT